MQSPSEPTPRRPRWRKTKIALGILVVLLLAAIAFLFRPMASPAGPAAQGDRPLDMVVIGGGVMSVTLATYLQELAVEPRQVVRGLTEPTDGRHGL